MTTQGIETNEGTRAAIARGRIERLLTRPITHLAPRAFSAAEMREARRLGREFRTRLAAARQRLERLLDRGALAIAA